MLGELSYSLIALYRENLALFDIVNAVRGENYGIEEYDLCIDGFPRSANSYAVNLVQKMAPSIKIIHHIHAPAILKKTAGKIPTIVLIRDPREAILSEYIRDQHAAAKTPNITHLIKRYTQYYQVTKKLGDKITLVTFEQVTETPEEYLRAVAVILGAQPAESYSDIVSETMDESQARVTKEIIYTTSVPNEARTEYKDKIGQQVLQGHDFSTAEQVYNQLIYKMRNV